MMPVSPAEQPVTRPRAQNSLRLHKISTISTISTRFRIDTPATVWQNLYGYYFMEWRAMVKVVLRAGRGDMRIVTAGFFLAVALLISIGGCEGGPGNTGPQGSEIPAPDTEGQQACMPHPADQIVGDWDSTDSVHERDDEVYSFHADGTYQHTWRKSYPEPGLDGETRTRIVATKGSYSYVAVTCTLTWAPESANLDNFVAWDGPDRFCTKFNSRGSCSAMFNRKPIQG